jgi:surface polysaccharide O-acyltransferase-like enzyme
MDNLRALLIIALLLLHVTSNENIASLASPNTILIWDAFNHALTPFRMPIFFFISGILSVSTIRSKWSTVLKKSTLRFSYLGILWGGLAAVIVSILDHTLNWEILLNVFAESIWFLAALAIYIPITKALSRLNVYLPTIVGIVSFVIAAPLLSTHFSALSSISFYFFYFSIGVIFSKNLLGKKITISWKTILVSSVLFLISAYIMKQAPVGIADTTSRFLANGFATVLGVSVAIKLLNKPIQSLTKIGRNTIGIYLVHSTLLFLFSKFVLDALTNYGILTLDEFGSLVVFLAFIFTAVFVTFVIKNMDNYLRTYLLTDPFSGPKKPNDG